MSLTAITDIPHFGFIAAAFAISTIVVAGMIAAIWWDYRDLLGKLARLETKR